MSLKGKRIADDFYLNEKDNIKHTDKLILKKIKKFKNKELKVTDIGFGNANLINLLKTKSQKWKCVGLDVNKKLIKRAKLKYPNIDFYKFDLMKSRIKKKFKSDIIICIGVVQIFDDLKMCLNKILNLTNKGGRIYIISIFSPYKVDIFNKYRTFNNKNLQLGWNRHSIYSVENQFKKNNKTKKIKITQINFPMSLKVKKTKDPLRSWTVKFNKKIYFYNSTGIQYQFLIEVEKK